MRPLFLGLIFIILPFFVIAQSDYISFSAQSTDNGDALSLDSVYIKNLSNETDTTLYNGVNLHFGYFTGNYQLTTNPDFKISRCYPSISELTTHISMSLGYHEEINIGIFNISGAKLSSFSKKLDPGSHAFEISIAGLAQGSYFIKVLSGSRVQLSKFIKIGPSSGAECEIHYQGSAENYSIPFKSNTNSIQDTYLFVGYSQDCVSDTIDQVIPEEGQNFYFGFTKGKQAGFNPCDSSSIWYDWKCYPEEYLLDWEMGESEISYVHNDKTYRWYIDQKYTGPHSNNNCGPASVTMAATWSDSSFVGSCEDARETYRPDGGWWYTNNIVDYLNLHSIPNTVVPFTDSSQLEKIIEEGAVVILCLNTAHLRRTLKSDQRSDRFYSYADGHFLVVKGVRVVDDQMYFETYDPNNWGMKYYDTSQKGKNRHYRSEDIAQAVSQWWKYLIIVYPKGVDPMKMDLQDAVDPSLIQHNYGK